MSVGRNGLCIGQPLESTKDLPQYSGNAPCLVLCMCSQSVSLMSGLYMAVITDDMKSEAYVDNIQPPELLGEMHPDFITASQGSGSLCICWDIQRYLAVTVTRNTSVPSGEGVLRAQCNTYSRRLVFKAAGDAVWVVLPFISTELSHSSSLLLDHCGL